VTGSGGGTEAPAPAPVVTRVDPDDEDAFAPCVALRTEVFVREQGVPPELEIDGRDPTCLHFAARDPERGVLWGTARMRVVPGPGGRNRGKAERVAVAAAARRRGIGRALMAAIEDEARRAGLTEVVLAAQESAIPFYLALGYAVTGTPFEEAGIPHRTMTRRLG